MHFTFNNLRQLAVEHESNKDWYRRARRSIVKYAKESGVPPRTLIGVVAITSQNIQLNFNEVLVREWVENGANANAAFKVRHYTSVQRNLHEFLTTGIVRGPKVSAFYNALLGNEESIVLDTHMKVPFRVDNWTVGNMKRASSAIARVALDLGWSNAQTQAAIWCNIYKQKNPKKKVANYKF